MGISTAGAAVRLTSDNQPINTVAPGINSVTVGNERYVAMTIMIIGADVTVGSTRSNAYWNDVLQGKDALGGHQINVGATPRTLGVDLPTVAITVGAEGFLSVVVTPANTNTWHFLAKISAVELK
jgi:hypothetical protein